MAYENYKRTWSVKDGKSSVKKLFYKSGVQTILRGIYRWRRLIITKIIMNNRKI